MRISSQFLGFSVLFFCCLNFSHCANIPGLLKTHDPPLLSPGKDFVQETKLNSTFRLSTALRPNFYRIELRPILEEVPGSNDTLFTAPGKVDIQFSCLSDTNVITLHSRTVTIHPDTVKVSSESTGRPVPITRQEYKVEDDTYVIGLGENLRQSTNYTITLSYLANMDGKDGLNGIYRAHYVDDEGKTHNLAATHMEPTRARKAFPCFDEPGLKAEFEIVLGRRNNYHTLSNTEIVSTIDIPGLNGWKWDIYNRTVPMPTYLVAAVISDLVNVTATEGLFNKPVRIWATKKLIENGAGNYAAEVAAKTLAYFEKGLFDTVYDLSKMDSAAIPQFSPGAMENWGLNLYRENLLLIFPGITSEAERQDVANVIGHELAHQWFGNHVTCKWWSDIWLNEGFATYFSYEAEKITAPELEPSKRFFTEVFQVALQSDVLPTTTPIHNPSLETVNVSPVFFNRIAYEKAGSVIRMFDRVFGEDEFALRLWFYLRAMKFQGAEQDDLFRELDRNSDILLPEGMTAKIFFDSWTLKSGYPLVRVSKLRDDIGYISQEIFTLNRAHQATLSGETNSGPFWHIPLRIVEAKTPHMSKYIWLKDNELSKTVREFDLSQWITVNPDASGFYRVLYDEELTTYIENQLNVNASVFAPVTRAQYIDDYMTFASAEYTNYGTSLKLTKFLTTETDLVVWETALGHFKGIYAKLSHESADVTTLKNYLLPKINSALDLIQFDHPENEKGVKVILRSILLTWACLLQDSRCVDFAQVKFQEWTNSNGLLPPTITGDYQELVYCTALAHMKDTSPFDFTYGKYIEETNPVHKTRLLNSLACAEATTLENLLKNITDPASGLLEADRVPLLQSIASNVNGRSIVIEFLKTNFGPSLFVTPTVFSTVLTTLGGFVHGSDVVADIEEFIRQNANALAPVSSSLEAAVSQMKLNNEWHSTTGAAILEWLEVN